MYIEIPTKCPVCGADLVKETKYSTMVLKCPNQNCRAKIENKVLHFIGQSCLDIYSMSIQTVKDLIDYGWINELSDLFLLKGKKDEWLKKTGYSEIKINKILNNIESAKTIELWKVIAGASIPSIERKMSVLLANHFGTFENFILAVENNYDFTKIKGIGITKANDILNFDYTEIKKAALFLNIQSDEKKTGKYDGLTFCITGKLFNYNNRNELVKEIEDNGGKIVGITKNTNYLISNDKNSTSGKSKKAKELGVKIISEEEFLAL